MKSIDFTAIRSLALATLVSFTSTMMLIAVAAQGGNIGGMVI